MKLVNYGTALFLGLIALAPSTLRAQDGTDISQAIPIYFGQSISDILDSQLKPFQVYRITLAQGQKFSAAGAANKGWCIGLFGPATRTVANVSTDLCSGGLANDFRKLGISIDYQVPAAGTYFIFVGVTVPSVSFTFQATATGTPIAVPNPPTAGCLTGLVDSITYSLQLIAAGLPDEVSIGGTKACASCAVKAPLYPEISNRLESALRSRINVQACYDSAGNIFQIKLVQP